jgi:hypothetical protein
MTVSTNTLLTNHAQWMIWSWHHSLPSVWTSTVSHITGTVMCSHHSCQCTILSFMHVPQSCTAGTNSVEVSHPTLLFTQHHLHFNMKATFEKDICTSTYCPSLQDTPHVAYTCLYGVTVFDNWLLSPFDLLTISWQPIATSCWLAHHIMTTDCYLLLACSPYHDNWLLPPVSYHIMMTECYLQLACSPYHDNWLLPPVSYHIMTDCYLLLACSPYHDNWLLPPVGLLTISWQLIATSC